jgi:hypothetical protein
MSVGIFLLALLTHTSIPSLQFTHFTTHFFTDFTSAATGEIMMWVGIFLLALPTHTSIPPLLLSASSVRQALY